MAPRPLQRGAWLALLFAMAVTGAAAQANQEGARLYQAKGCALCHGKEGRAPVQPDYPRLDGQNSAYLLRQMKDIKSGRRDNGESRTMRTIMAFVNETEMWLIAEYLSRLK